jgi:hypothetical protein
VTETAELIDILVQRASPVRRLRSPLMRAGLWLAFAMVVLAVFAVCHGLDADLAAHLGQPDFTVGIGAALATGILAAVAAFELSLPDRPRWLLLLPVPTLAVWIGATGYGCLTDWIAIRGDGMEVGESLRCFAIMLLASVPLAIALALMLHYAALLRSGGVAFMGGLAIASITSVAHALLHGEQATAMILAWNLGAAALITASTSLVSGGLFAWLEARLRMSFGVAQRL